MITRTDPVIYSTDLLTEEQQKYVAWLLTSRRSGDDDMRVAGVLSFKTIFFCQ